MSEIYKFFMILAFYSFRPVTYTLQLFGLKSL
jgi:hypothetical protein